MAEFCKNCITKHMGLTPKDKFYKDWLIPDGNGMICEGCGYEYLKQSEDFVTVELGNEKDAMSGR